MFSALTLWLSDPPLTRRPPGVAAAQPGEAGVNPEESQKSEDYRFVTRAATHPAVSRLSCHHRALSGTPLGRPRQRLTAVRPGPLRARLLTPLRLRRRTALSTGPPCRPHRPLAGKLESHGAAGMHGQGSETLGCEAPSAASCSWTSDAMLKPSEPQFSHLRCLNSLTCPVRTGWHLPEGRREVAARREPHSANGAASVTRCFLSPAWPCRESRAVFMVPSSASASSPLALSGSLFKVKVNCWSKQSRFPGSWYNYRPLHVASSASSIFSL